MRVLYDNLAFDIQKVGGVSRYFAELMDAMRQNEFAQVKAPFFFTSNQYLRDKHFPTIWPVPAHLPGRIRLNSLTTRLSLAFKEVDIFHMTYYDITLVDFIRCPLVVTVLDMIPELFPHLFGDSLAIHPGKRALCDIASAIISISHNTKADLVRLFGVDPAKIFVTHLGIDPQWSQRSQAVPGLPEMFLLYVGSRTAYKNFDSVIQSMVRLSRLCPDLYLVCVGGGPFDQRERDMLHTGLLHERVQLRELSDYELAYCYKKAVALVFPSLYEGFGLPILESFLSACPIILANRSCFQEIAGEAAHYFEPDNPETLDNAIQRVVHDSGHRLKLIERGVSRVSSFTWYNTASKTATVYRKLM